MPTAYEFTDWGSTPRSGFVQLAILVGSSLAAAVGIAILLTSKATKTPSEK